VQVLRWANSSLYGNLKNITSIEEAIHRVLGLNFVIDILLTLSIMKPLQFQKQGQIGSKMFWLHIFSSIALTKELIKNIDPAIRPNQDEIKALILLHNIGYPLLNDLFTEEFLFLAQAIDSNMNLSIPNIEDLLIGTSHAQIGAWLAENWNLPDLFKTIIYHHHNPNYRGDYYIHNLVIYTNNYLLGKLQIGDGINQLCNDEIYSILNLDDNKCQKYVDSISDELPNFLTLAETML
jgi:HD-like signal output (HDOD) protein